MKDEFKKEMRYEATFTGGIATIFQGSNAILANSIVCGINDNAAAKPAPASEEKETG